MGTGKTCTAVAVAEQFIEARNRNEDIFPHTVVKNIMVLTKGKGLHGNFIYEVANVCTRGQYLQNELYLKNRDKKIKKNVKVNYTFNTFEIFSKSLTKMSKGEQSTLFENTLFIVDEAHNLRPTNDDERSIYGEIAALFDFLKHKKVLLLTGTPMKDRPEEILDLLNLILKNKLRAEDLANEPAFKQKVRGYVSYLRSMMSDVDRTEEGRLMGTLAYFRVYPVTMDAFQSSAYATAKRQDDEERSIFSNSRQASLMVFPDQTYGKIGFESNVVQTSSGYKFSGSAIAELRTNLRRYSAKYADLLEKTASDYSSGRLSFVFSEFVKGSGLIVLSLLLELNGYTRATSASNLSVQQKRYAIFTNETSTNAETRKLIAAFNSPKNVSGKYISIILGSRVIMEGFSFKNIQSEYILTPHWNYSETSQIIARGFRLGSHNDLIRAGIVPEVKIYQYVALPREQSLGSVDLHMYEISEEKDFRIQKVIRTLKEAAFDCELSKERNLVANANLDNTRSCEYSSCEYSCDSLCPRSDLANDRNFRLLYFRSSQAYVRLKHFIIQKVAVAPTTIQEILEESGPSGEYSKFEISCVLEDLLHFQEILFSRPDGSYYLSSIKGVYFASSNNTRLSDEDDPWLLKFYNENIPIFTGKTIDELIYDNQKNFMVSLVDKIFASKNLTDLQKHIVQLPLYLQENLLCFAISSKYKHSQNNFVRDMVLNNYRLYYKIKGETGFVWLNASNYTCSPRVQDFTSWRRCNSDEQLQVENMKKERTISKVTSSPYGYIGLLNRNSNDFCLKKIEDGENVDKRKRHVGKRCQNWKKKELVELVSNRLKIKPDDEEFEFEESDAAKMRDDPKLGNIIAVDGTLRDYKRLAFWNAQDVNYLCNKIMQKLIDQELVVDDPNCGTAKKLR